MKSNNSRKITYILTKKYLLLFLITFVAAILFFLEHFTENPISVADIQIGKIFNEKKKKGAQQLKTSNATRQLHTKKRMS